MTTCNPGHASSRAEVPQSLRVRVILSILAAALSGTAAAQLQIVPTISAYAGMGTPGFSGDGGPATAAQFSAPTGMVFDTVGNLYIADTGNNRVRKIAAGTGTITTVAGTGVAGFNGDGTATGAQLNKPQGLAVDAAGNVYIADSLNERVRELVVSTGMLTTVAGTGAAGFSGDGGAATLANMDMPVSVAVDVNGNLYISDSNNNRVRRVVLATGVISTFAGSGPAGAGTGSFSGDGNPADSATFSNPGALFLEPNLSSPNIVSELLIWDSGNHRLRQVDVFGSGLIGNVTERSAAGTVGGGDGGDASLATYVNITGMARTTSTLYLVDAGANQVRAIDYTSSLVTTVAGTGTAGSLGDGGLAPAAQLSLPSGIVIDDHGNALLSDSGNNRLREIQRQFPMLFPSTNVGSTSATTTLTLSALTAETITSISVPASVGGVQEFTVGTITGCVVDGHTSNPAGSICKVPIAFKPGYVGTREVPLQTVTPGGLNNFGLRGVGVGPLASLTPGGTTTLPNLGKLAVLSPGGLGPACAVEDFAGNIFICDAIFYYVKRVDAKTGAVTNIAGDGFDSGSIEGAPAVSSSISFPKSIAIDSSQNLYFGDPLYAPDFGSDDGVLYRIDQTTGQIHYVAGKYPVTTAANLGDGGPALHANVNTSQQIAISNAGNIYIADYNHARVRKINGSTGIITTYAGVGVSYGVTGGGDGSLATAAQLKYVTGVAVDPMENVYIADPTVNLIWKVDAATGIIHIFAGTGTAGFSGDGGPARSAQFSAPTRLALDPAGNLYVTDVGNFRVRRIDAATGIVSTVLGTGYAGFTPPSYPLGNNYPSYTTPGSATSVNLLTPTDVFVTSAGDLLVSDDGGNVFRVSAASAVLNYPTIELPGAYDAADSPQGFSVANIGNAPLTVSTPSSGTNPSLPAGSTLDASSTCPQLSSSSAPFILAPGTNCGIYNVDLTVQTTGVNTSTATLADNSLNAATTNTVTLIGHGADIYSINAAMNITWVADATDSPVYTFDPATNNYDILRLDYGSIVTFTLTLTHQAVGANQTIPGTVAFYVNGNLISGGASIPVQNGVATFTTTNLPIGNDTFTAIFTPDSGSGYPVTSPATASYEYVSAAVPKFTYTKTHVIYDGQPHTVTVTPAKAGLQPILTYQSSALNYSSTTPPTRAGTYDVFVSFADPAYGGGQTFSTISQGLIIDHVQGSLTLSNLSAVYDGNPHPVTFTVTPASETAAVQVFYNGSSTVPSAAGVYQVFAVISSTLSNYTATATGTLIIAAGGSSVWIANQDSTVSRLSTAGAVLSTAGTPASASTLGAIGIDSSGDAWSVVNGVNALKEVSPSGTLLGSHTGGGLSAPVSLAIDGLGQVWVANTNNSVSSFSNSGGALSPATGYLPGGLSTPSAIAVDQTGSVWITNAASSSVTRILGVAAPVIAPTVTALPTTATGTRP